jgi:hypothetical protein
MPFPRTLDELKAAGYRFDNEATCRGCGDDLEWWISPTGKKIPINPMSAGTSLATAHWATCSESDSFRKKS